MAPKPRSPIKQFSEVSGALDEASPQCPVMPESLLQQAAPSCVRAQLSDHAPHPHPSPLLRVVILVQELAVGLLT